ncbi:MAG: hypothetical protein WD907_07455, partial [Bacilli bacterium]
YFDEEMMGELAQFEALTEEEINEIVTEIGKSVTINNAKFDTVIDKEGFIRKNVVKIDMSADIPDFGSGKFGITVNSNMNHINEKVTFKLDVPKIEDTISAEELGLMVPPGVGF